MERYFEQICDQFEFILSSRSLLTTSEPAETTLNSREEKCSLADEVCKETTCVENQEGVAVAKETNCYVEGCKDVAVVKETTCFVDGQEDVASSKEAVSQTQEAFLGVDCPGIRHIYGIDDSDSDSEDSFDGFVF